MKLSYNWICELSGSDWTVDEMAKRLTDCGTACEDVEATDRYLDKVIVGEVTDLQPIKGADKIRLASVNCGDQSFDLVCGAPNVAVDQKVAVALVGAKLAGDITIKKAKIRGVESCGMICSERELGLSDDHSGIIVLDSDAPIGTPLADYLQLRDYQLTFELTPNRADSMSAIGVARDVVALSGTILNRPEVSLNEIDEKTTELVSVTIEDRDVCPRYAARIIKNLKIGESPWWLKQRLLTSGIRPINNIVDITNYVMLETGHPLHAFDFDRFGSNEVLVRRANKGEIFTTLDGKEHNLIDDVILITNGKEGVAAGGVMGGLNSEVESTTTNILLESAYFDPSLIRKSRKHLGFVSESSTRFEKGADPEGVIYAINRAASLYSELCGGDICAGIVDCYPQAIEQRTVSLRPKRCNDLLGTELSTDRMVEILKLLEFDVAIESEKIVATVPTFRPDIEREVDLIEEIVRIDGFDKVPDAITNTGPLFTPTHYVDKFQDEMRQQLVAAGYDEILTHGLTDSRLADAVLPGKPQLKIVNPSSQDLNILRNSMVLSALPVIGNNLAHRNTDLCLFELGKVYFPPDESGQWIEDQRLMAIVTGATPHTWRDRPRNYDFYDLSGLLDVLVSHFRWPKITIDAGEVSFLDNTMSYRLIVQNEGVGVIGLLDPKVAKKSDIKQPVYLLELSLARFMEEDKRESIHFEPLPAYPAAPRDLAMVVDLSVPAGELLSAVRKSAGPLAESVSIFDLYAGKQIEKGKKSIAISVTYRSRSGSLSSDEVDAAQANVIKMVKRQFNAEIRDK